MINKGELVDSGTYQEWIENNLEFKKMAKPCVILDLISSSIYKINVFEILKALV